MNPARRLYAFRICTTTGGLGDWTGGTRLGPHSALKTWVLTASGNSTGYCGRSTRKRLIPIGDGSLPVKYKNVLDPLETLTFAAAHTRRIALGTSVLNLPWYNPVLLACRLTTVDVLSAGRLRVGFGIGWSPDEYEAAGVTWEERGKRADELLQALKRIWTTDPVEFHGRYYRIPESVIGPKPVQKPHPPILYGRLYAFRHEASRNRGKWVVSSRYSAQRHRADVRRDQGNGTGGWPRPFRLWNSSSAPMSSFIILSLRKIASTLPVPLNRFSRT